MTREPSVEEWQVWWQDDAGNRYLIVSGLSEAEAHKLLAEYERRGHKQLYWVQRGSGK